MHAADEHVPEAPLVQELRQLAHESLAERVAWETAVAESVFRLGRDHVGRVADREIEPLAFDRFEEVTVAELDVREPVQESVEPSERVVVTLLNEL